MPSQQWVPLEKGGKTEDFGAGQVTSSALGSASSVAVPKTKLPLKEVAKGAGVRGEEEHKLSHAWGEVANIGCRTHGGCSE